MSIFCKKITSLFLLLSIFFANASVVGAQNASANCACPSSCSCPPPCPPNCSCSCPCQCPEPAIVEHLPTYKGSSINMVKVTNSTATIAANNVLRVTFSDEFNSKNVCEDNRISFRLQDGLTTVEGRRLLPCGTQIIGRIQCVEKPKWMNRNAKVYIVFDQIVLPNCVTIPMCAKVYGKDSVLKRSSWAAVGKAAGYTVGLFGIGTGLGAAIGAAANAAGRGALVFGMPIGGGVGLLAGTITPGLNYKAKCGQCIYIQLAQDLVICYK